VLYVDPSCPFAWITSRWLSEVQAQIPIELSIRLMSISVLNEDRDLEPWYRDFNDRAWGPARLLAAAAETHGEQVIGDLYRALGRRIHVQRQDFAAEVAVAALAEAGLLTSLAGAAGSTAYDGYLRRSHLEAVESLGDEAGTPMIHLDGKPLFGPVLTQIPRGEQAVAVFDAVRTLSGCSAWADLRRPREPQLVLS